MSEYDMSIHYDRDASVWARFFVETKKRAAWTLEDIDEELMLGWFANAMMAMHDTSIDPRVRPSPVAPTPGRTP